MLLFTVGFAPYLLLWINVHHKILKIKFFFAAFTSHEKSYMDWGPRYRSFGSNLLHLSFLSTYDKQQIEQIFIIKHFWHVRAYIP